MKCEGCEYEMEYAYELQELGYDVGLEWFKGHCFLFALDKNGDYIIE